MVNKWDKRMLELSKLVSTWSKDPDAQVGAVIVDKNNRVVALGFNGFPRGVRDDSGVLRDRERRLMRTIHAEENALLFANRSVEGMAIYVNAHPCAKCAAKIIQAGVAKIVCGQLDRDFEKRWATEFEEAQAMIAEARVEIIIIPDADLTRPHSFG